MFYLLTYSICYLSLVFLYRLLVQLLHLVDTHETNVFRLVMLAIASVGLTVIVKFYQRADNRSEITLKGLAILGLFFFSCETIFQILSM